MSAGSLPISAAKFAGLVVAMMASAIVGGMVFYAGVAPPADFDAGAHMTAQAIVSIATALVIALIAVRMRVSKIAAASVIALLVFIVQTLLTQMEAVYFGADLGIDIGDTVPAIGSGVISALVAGLVTAFLFAPGATGETAAARKPAAWAWRFPLATLLYPVAYWCAGLGIAWQFEAVREFYQNVGDIDPAQFLAFQVLRGAIWAALVFVVARAMGGSVVVRAVLIGAALAVLMAVLLVYPGTPMPEMVRVAHSIEIGVSNFLYGFVATLLLAPKRV